MNLFFNPGKIVRFLFIITAIFTLVHIIVQISNLVIGQTMWLYLFDLDRVQSIPRFFSVVLLLTCAGTTFFIAAVSRQNNLKGYYHWMGFGLVLLVFAVYKNNSFAISPMLIIQSIVNFSKTAIYALVLGILLIGFGITYFNFFLGLSTKMKKFLVSGAFIYFFGAVAMDFMNAYLSHTIGQNSIIYIVSAMLEEVLEMVGIIVFLYAFLYFIGDELKTITIQSAR